MARISKQQLIKLQKKYKTDDAIGKLYNITRQAVHQLRLAYGIDIVRDKNDERNQEIVQAFKNGMSGIKLAKKYNLSTSHTYRIIHGR
jgi:Mor family transcriptional regulator